jgi:drug/metabolite transporter (DMT)-like permease
MALNVFQDPQETAAWVVCIIFTPICILATVLRFVATKRAGRAFGWEDWFALLGLVFFLPYIGYLIYSKPEDEPHLPPLG